MTPKKYLNVKQQDYLDSLYLAFCHLKCIYDDYYRPNSAFEMGKLAESGINRYLIVQC